MSIIIKGMEMPTGCGLCPLNTGSYYCAALGKFAVDEKRVWTASNIRRLKDCPLHELPPHGDLIERSDALAFPLANGKYDHENANKHFIFGCETYAEYLEQMPVIVPADKEVQDALS